MADSASVLFELSYGPRTQLRRIVYTFVSGTSLWGRVPFKHVCALVPLSVELSTALTVTWGWEGGSRGRREAGSLLRVALVALGHFLSFFFLKSSPEDIFREGKGERERNIDVREKH